MGLIIRIIKKIYILKIYKYTIYLQMKTNLLLKLFYDLFVYTLTVIYFMSWPCKVSWHFYCGI